MLIFLRKAICEAPLSANLQYNKGMRGKNFPGECHGMSLCFLAKYLCFLIFG